MGEWEEAVGGGSEIVTEIKGCVHRQGNGIDRKGSEIVTAAADMSINYFLRRVSQESVYQLLDTTRRIQRLSKQTLEIHAAERALSCDKAYLKLIHKDR